MIRMLIALLALVSGGAASAAWQQASSPHFVVYSDDDPQKVRDFTAKLERFDLALRELRGVADPPTSPLARVTVYIVRNIGAVQKLMGHGGGDVAGFFVPRASGSVAFVPRHGDDEDLSSLAILLHEYSHHFMFSNWGDVAFPAWLVEGFAEFNATAKFMPDGAVLFGSAPMYRAYGMLDHDLVPMRKLLTADPNLLPDDARQTFYARSWLLLHYLTLDPERRKRLSAYFAAVNKGASPAETTALLGDPRKLDVQINTYAMSGRMFGYSVPAARLHVPDIGLRALSPGEAAIMPARMASVRGVDGRTAPGVAETARRAAAPFAHDAAVQNELAEAEFDAGNFAASQAAAERALAAEPKSVHAMLYAGMSRAAALHAAKRTDEAAWREVRGWYSRANHADPEYAYPLALFYGSYAAAGQAPTPNAQAGLLYARALAPYDPDLGMGAAYVLLKQGKPAEASAILKPIAYNPHGGGDSAAALKLLEMLGHGDTAAALAMFDQDKAPPSSPHAAAN